MCGRCGREREQQEGGGGGGGGEGRGGWGEGLEMWAVLGNEWGTPGTVFSVL